MSVFDFSELDDFSNNLLDLAETKMPKETKKFLKKEANKLKKETKKKARRKTKRISGNYLKGFKSGKVYRYKGDELSIRVYNSSPHAHLIEEGHDLIKGGTHTKDGNKGGEKIGEVEGKHILRDSSQEFESQYFNDLDEFLDNILEKGL